MADVVAAADAVAHLGGAVRALLLDRAPGAPVLVALDGRSGSGKTTLARRLTRELRDGGVGVTVLHLDHVYPGWDGLAAASQRLGHQLLPRLRAGTSARYPSWSWLRDRPGPHVEVRPSEVVLVDGVGSGSRAARALLDLLVWLEAPEPVRHARAMARDGDAYAPHWHRWAEQERRYLAAEQPWTHADVVVATADPTDHGPPDSLAAVTDTQAPVIESPDVDGEDLAAWRNTFSSVFALPAATTEEVDAVREGYRSQRLTGVREDGRWVATFRSWAGDSAVPGGALTGHDDDGGRTVATDLVSTVAVAPTHRRRGLLTRLMSDSLRHAAESGVVVSSLFASEAAIYGRYGFGVATRVHDLTVDTRAAAAWHAGAPADPGRMRLSDDDEIAAVGPALFDTARRRMPGSVGRTDVGWLRVLERVAPTPKPDGPRLRAVHVAPDGTVDGYVRLRLEMRWTDGAPANKATVDDLVGATPAVLAALWRFCVDLDLVTTLVAEHRGHGELLPHLTADPRAVRVTSAVDGHWWRVLDAPAALAARSWSGPGQVVLDVVDPGGPAAGRWEVSVDDTGDAEVRPTTRSADVALPVQSLPAVLTGVLDLTLLHAAGRLDEHRSGAVRRLERMSRVSPVALGTVQGF